MTKNSIEYLSFKFVQANSYLSPPHTLTHIFSLALMFIVIISKGFPVAGPAPHNLKIPQKVAPVAGPTIMLLPAGRKFGRKTQKGTILMRA